MPTHTVPDSNVTFTSPPDLKTKKEYKYGETSPRIKELFEYVAARFTSMGHKVELGGRERSLELRIDGEDSRLHAELVFNKVRRTFGPGLAVYLGDKFSQTARYPEGSKNGISVEKLIKDLSAIPESRRKAREAREARESRKQKLEEAVATLLSPLDQANFCPDAYVQDVKAHGADGDILYEMTLKNLSPEQAEAVVAVLRETGVQYETRGY